MAIIIKSMEKVREDSYEFVAKSWVRHWTKVFPTHKYKIKKEVVGINILGFIKSKYVTYKIETRDTELDYEKPNPKWE